MPVLDRNHVSESAHQIEQHVTETLLGALRSRARARARHLSRDVLLPEDYLATLYQAIEDFIDALTNKSLESVTHHRDRILPGMRAFTISEEAAAELRDLLSDPKGRGPRITPRDLPKG